MKYIDEYPNCVGCPVEIYCGTVVGCFKLCASYKTHEICQEEKESFKNLEKEDKK